MILGGISFRQLLSICFGLMLLAFGLISVMTEGISLVMIPMTLLMFVGGGYLTYKGFMGAIRTMGGQDNTDSPIIAEKVGHICPNCGNVMKVNENFCGECGHKLF